MVESEKLAALGGLVAGMAHEINTPVGIAVTAASHLVDRTAELRAAWQAGSMKRSTLDHYIEGVKDAGRLILTNLERSNELVQSFKQVAVDQSSEDRRTFAVRDYLEDILRSLRPKLKRTPHLVEIDCDPDLTLTSYPGALAQVLTNLVLNSVVHGYADGVSGRIDLRPPPGTAASASATPTTAGASPTRSASTSSNRSSPPAAPRAAAASASTSSTTSSPSASAAPSPSTAQRGRARGSPSTSPTPPGRADG